MALGCLQRVTPGKCALTSRGDISALRPAMQQPLPSPLCFWSLGATLRAAKSSQQLCLVTVLPSGPCLLPCSLELSWEPEGSAGREAETAGKGEEQGWYWLGVVGAGKGEEMRLGEEDEKHAAASPSPMESEEKKADC